MILSIDLEKKKEQAVSVTLNGQNCVIELSQQERGLFFSLYLNNNPLVINVLCLNDVKLVRYKHLWFIGDLYFHDNQGDDSPSYEGLVDRFTLYYDGDL